MRKMCNSKREDAVLNMQVTLIPILMRSWNVSSKELSEIMDKYDLLSYIDVCYEMYNSMGNQGIVEDLENYIEIQGGKIC